MADHRFTANKELEPLDLKLDILLFLFGRSQLLKNEMTESQSIALVRIQVERAITLIKTFKVVNHILLSLFGFTNQIGTVACLLWIFFYHYSFKRILLKYFCFNHIILSTFCDFYISLTLSLYPHPPQPKLHLL